MVIAVDTAWRTGHGLRVGGSIGTRGSAAVGNSVRDCVESALGKMRKDRCGNPVAQGGLSEDMESTHHGSALAGPRQPIGS
jgi:hypothetical protein